jgi:large subunit ribosomal protein L4
MPTLDVKSVDDRKAGSIDLAPEVFEAPVKPHLYQAEVRRQLALRRAGTHSTRNRAFVAGGGAKPYRQKGTGRARQGSIRAPQWEGGGVVFGPVPRGYAHKLPRKVRQGALRSALSQRLAEGALVVVDALPLEEYRTRRVVEMLEGLGLSGEGVLVVLGEANAFLEKSARNLAGVSVLRSEGLNVYDVLRHPRLLLTRDAVEKVQARLGAAGGEETA